MYEFVSFKTAKVAAKHGIVRNDKYYNHYRYNKEHYKNTPMKCEYGGDGYDDDIYAPTLFELQKELREKYGIIVEVNINFNSKFYYNFFYNNFIIKNSVCNNLSTKEFKTYEEAFDKGLRKAIKKLN